MKENKDLLKKIEHQLLNEGIGELSDSDLISLIIRKGTNEYSVLEVANNLLKTYGNAKELIGLYPEEITNDNPSLNLTKSIQIVAAIELGRRAYLAKEEVKYINSVDDIISYLAYDMSRLEKEHFKVILLNTKNMIISCKSISIGTINASLVHTREVFSYAIKKGANVIVLAHNHPSGMSTPSKEDITLTKKLVEVGKILGIEVMDHVVIGKDNYFSFKEENMI